MFNLQCHNPTEIITLTTLISTLPAAVKFKLPKYLLAKGDSEMVVFDVNYKSFITSLLQQAKDAILKVMRWSKMSWT